mgnify:CR=1 FL=1
MVSMVIGIGDKESIHWEQIDVEKTFSFDRCSGCSCKAPEITSCKFSRMSANKCASANKALSNPRLFLDVDRFDTSSGDLPAHLPRTVDERSMFIFTADKGQGRGVALRIPEKRERNPFSRVIY